MKILVVDDELDVKDMFMQRFRKQIKAGSIELIFAHSAFDALKLLSGVNESDCMLILSDINMPEMTGFELLLKVKELKPEIKVFMVSAYGDSENMNKAKSFGADDFIVKPVDFKLLEDKLFQYL
jgi:two-component system chemotaxis response regulator CheY